MDPSAAIQIIILLILLVLSAFFSSAETALTTVDPIRLRTLMENEGASEKKRLRAKRVLDIKAKPEKMLSAILIGNNIVNLSASALTASLAYGFGGYMIGIATFILTILILIFGEIIPKTVASLVPKKTSLLYSPYIYIIILLLTPVIWMVTGISARILKPFGMDIYKKKSPLTEGVIRTIVNVGHEDGVIEEEERTIINNLFDMGEAKAKDIMVPRVHISSVAVSTTYEELLEVFREDMYTRYPVFDDSGEHIAGTINMKDLLLCENPDTFHIQDILRKAHFTYEYKNISELLTEMKKDSMNIVIVLDEYGEVTGMITLEDILEEIVGEIHDEFDEEEEAPIRKISDYEYLVEGSTNLDECNKELNLHLTSEDYDSLGGFIMEKLDRLPKLHDEILTEDSLRLVVEGLDKNRIETVHIYLPKNIVCEDIHE